MTLTPFNDNWTLRRADESETIAVRLPHDAMISERRSASSETGSHGGYFPGGRYVYSTEWRPKPASGDRRYRLIFEGIYGQAIVRVDGKEVAASASGYREFAVPLAVAGDESLAIEVEVDNSAVPNSRWYTGSGIYRKVWLEETGPDHLVAGEISLTTSREGDAAHVAVAIHAEVDRNRRFVAEVELNGPDGRASFGEVSLLEGRGTAVVHVQHAHWWSAETPNLYDLTVRLVGDAGPVDQSAGQVGLRTIDVSAEHGLRINGDTVKLRGACVHHDNGVLGAATFRAAEFRRARVLKDAGFNAIRSSHNPLSRDFLDACDQVGLYVLDELTDTWFVSKTRHDSAPRFGELWRDDVASMVAKDRLHPSVIMYSIGNEIAESGTARGVVTASEISNAFKELDSDRPTTIALNFLLNVMAASGRSLFDTSEHNANQAEKKPSAITSTTANVLANRIGSIMQLVAKLPKADKESRSVFEQVEVAGYNYAWGRYSGDAKRHPHRVVLGTESLPGDIVKIWPLVTKYSNVIGDFVWTGWDYLGESGIGTWSYGSADAAISKAFPELVAGCGLIDITGRPDAALLLSQAAWGLLESPQIAVRPLNVSGDKVHRVAWRSTDAVQSWAWSDSDGQTADIEVYSTDDEVELLINGRSAGRKPAGASKGFVTRFRVPYESGELTAVGWKSGLQTSKSSLISAGPTKLRLATGDEGSPMAPDGQDLRFVQIELADASGIVEMLDDDVVTVTVAGGGILAGLGNADRASEESFSGCTYPTWRGRALAVVRSDRSGAEIEVTVRSRHHGDATIVLPVASRAVAATPPGLT